MVKKELATVCGICCGDCPNFKKECKGCSAVGGNPFWTEYLKIDICPLYDCCVNKMDIEHCGLCGKFACRTFMTMESNDPGLSKEKAEASANNRKRHLEIRRDCGTEGWLLIKDLWSDKAQVKYGCSKNLLQLSKENPALVFPLFGFFFSMTDNENNIFKWTAIDIISNLAAMAGKREIEQVISKLTGFLKCGVMITANHAVAGLAEIAFSLPGYSGRITGELIKVENYDYQTEECRRIVIGKTIISLDSIYDLQLNNDDVHSFIMRQLENMRPATRKKAEWFVKKHQLS